MHLIRVDGLTKRFGGLVAVSDVSFHVKAGEVLSVVGPNGAGKSTLFNLITGVIQADAGRVMFHDQDVTRLPSNRRARMGMSRTFQNIRLFPHLNALENVMVGGVAQSATTVKSAIEEAEALLDWVGVGANRFRLPAELPYGDQRRVEIARALATHPKLLILDEPTAGMVSHEAHEVINLIERLQASGVTLMLVEHNMNVVMSASDRVVVINFGQKIAEGSPAEILNNRQVIDAYLGVDE